MKSYKQTADELIEERTIAIHTKTKQEFNRITKILFSKGYRWNRDKRQHNYRKYFNRNKEIVRKHIFDIYNSHSLIILD